MSGAIIAATMAMHRKRREQEAAQKKEADADAEVVHFGATCPRHRGSVLVFEHENDWWVCPRLDCLYVRGDEDGED